MHLCSLQLVAVPMKWDLSLRGMRIGYLGILSALSWLCGVVWGCVCGSIVITFDGIGIFVGYFREVF